jgi:oxazoline/thiazoline synthase
VDAAAVASPGRVSVTAVGDRIDPRPLRRALAGARLDVLDPAVPDDRVSAEPDAAPSDLAVVLCTDYLDPALAAIDAAHRGAGRPWLLAKVDGARAWIGPVFRPGGGCWHCLAERLWAHPHAEAVVQRTLGRSGPAPRPRTSVRAAEAAVTQLVALEAAKWLAGHRYPGQQAVWIFDTRDLGGGRHELRARPQCPACGDPGLVAARTREPVRLRPAAKADTSGGGHRVLTAEQMLARHRHLISPVTGIVKRVVPDPHAPHFAHVFRSGVNLSRQVSGLAALRSGLRSENGGKGFTALDAQVGALGEAVERFCGTAQGDELRIQGSLRSLGSRAIDPRSWMLFDGRQYATRSSWNAVHGAFNQVPELFDPDASLDWTPLWSLSGAVERLLPTGMLYFGAQPVPSFYADSNGCAAGGSLEDAVLQWLLELVERDAVAIWWYNRLAVPEVDLAAFGDPRVRDQVGHHAGIGRALHVLDVTSDLGVPVMAAVSSRTDGGPERILLGFGAHLDPCVALRRAVSELNQMLPMDAARQVPSTDPDWVRWAATATLADQPHLRPDRSAAAHTPADHPYDRRADVLEDVQAVVDGLAAKGMETLVLDQTRPDVAVPVARVVLPGLRSFWARFAPGRLFDAPVVAGARERPTPYEELNSTMCRCSCEGTGAGIRCRTGGRTTARPSGCGRSPMMLWSRTPRSRMRPSRAAWWSSVVGVRRCWGRARRSRRRRSAGWGSDRSRCAIRCCRRPAA